MIAFVPLKVMTMFFHCRRNQNKRMYVVAARTDDGGHQDGQSAGLGNASAPVEKAQGYQDAGGDISRHAIGRPKKKKKQ
jgi:hypothetical protein